MDEEELLKRDPQFAIFHDDVASILQAFDRVKEWADLIRCLQRLGKSLSKFSKFSVVPQKIVLAKRLCQCLNPVLPSGVHLKALAVYELILSKIGDSIIEDAPLYCAGLFPLLQHASIQVRGPLLRIIDQHLIRRAASLSGALSGLVLSLTPGLEEEGTETYAVSFRMMSTLRREIGLERFFAAIYKGALGYPHYRKSFFAYLNKMIKVAEDEPNLLLHLHTFHSKYHTLVVPALVQTLDMVKDDGEVMVVRTVLDTIQLFFSMDLLHSEVSIPEEQVINFSSRILKILVCEEPSLIRRVYTWLFSGKEEPGSRETKHIEKSLKFLFANESTPPFDVAFSLHQKEEIKGSGVIENCLLPILEAVSKTKTVYDSTEASSKLLRSISLPRVWSFVSDLLEDTSTIESTLELIDGLTDLLPLGDLNACKMTSRILSSLSHAEMGTHVTSSIPIGLHICVKLLSGDMNQQEEMPLLIQQCNELLVRVLSNDVSGESEEADNLRNGFKYGNVFVMSWILRVDASMRDPELTEAFFETVLLASKHQDAVLSVSALESVCDFLLNESLGMSRSRWETLRGEYSFIRRIVERTWTLFPISNKECALRMVDLHKVNAKLTGEAVADVMLETSTFEQFLILWALIDELGVSVDASFLRDALFLSLDAFLHSRVTARNWLINSLRKAPLRIFDPLLFSVVDMDDLHALDEERMIYILYVWDRMLEIAADELIPALVGRPLSEDAVILFSAFFRKDTREFDYMRLVVEILLHSKRTHAISLVRKMLFRIEFGSSMSVVKVCEAILPRLASEIESVIGRQELTNQVEILFLMEGIFSHIWKAGHEIPIEVAPILALGVGTTQRVMSGSILSLLGHWVHYTIKFMPFFEASLPVIFGSLIPEFCNIMSTRAPNSITSHTVNIILNGISEFISFCTVETDQAVKDAEEEFKESTATGFLPISRFFAGIVKDVFRHDKTRDGESKEKRTSPKDEGLSVVFHLMPNVIQSLMNVWKKFQDHSRLLMTTTVRGLKDIEREESAAFLSFRTSVVKFFDLLAEFFPVHFILGLLQSISDMRDDIISVLKDMKNSKSASIFPALIKCICSEWQHGEVLQFARVYVDHFDVELSQLVRLSRDMPQNIETVSFLGDLSRRCIDRMDPADKRARKEIQEFCAKTIEASLALLSKEVKSKDVGLQKLHEIADEIATWLPALISSAFENDKDRAQPVILNVVNTLAPLCRSTNPSFGKMTSILSSLMPCETAHKILRTKVWEMFIEPRFFVNVYASVSSPNWIELVQSVMLSEAPLFDDLLKIEKAKPDTLKRVAFILFSGRKDQYHAHLPTILERLVDSLKNSKDDVQFQCVLFCFRVIITRASSRRLTAFWPIILSELMLLFSHPWDQSPRLLLEALKFIDLALVIAPEEFQIYEWMFVDILQGIENRKDTKGDPVESPGERHSQSAFSPYLVRLCDTARGGRSRSSPVDTEKEVSIDTQETGAEDATRYLRPIVHESDATDMDTIVNLAARILQESKQFWRFGDRVVDMDFINEMISSDFRSILTLLERGTPSS